MRKSNRKTGYAVLSFILQRRKFGVFAKRQGTEYIIENKARQAFKNAICSIFIK